MTVTAKDLTAKQNREQHAKKLKDAQAFHTEHGAEWTQERSDQFDRMLADSMDHKNEADLQDRKAKQASELKAHMDGLEDPAGTGSRQAIVDPNTANKAAQLSVRNGVGRYSQIDCGDRGQNDYRAAFNAFLRSGGNFGGLSDTYKNALQSDNDTQAGFLLVSEQLAAGILKEVDDLLFIRQNATVHTVTEAGTLGIRKRTARAATFGWSSELAVSAEDSTLAYGKKVLEPTHLTGLIKVSMDLLRRSTDAESEVISEMGIDAAEAMEDAFLTGSGANQPLGLFTASADGISTSRDVSTGNTTTAITADGLYENKYSLKAQYRMPTGSRSGARWLFHRSAVKMIAKLMDNNNHYLWQPALTEGQPDLLLGLPLDESERAPSTFTTGQYVGLVGNYRYYEIADALDIEIQRLVELYAATNQVGFIGRLKCDGLPTLEEAFSRVTLA